MLADITQVEIAGRIYCYLETEEQLQQVVEGVLPDFTFLTANDELRWEGPGAYQVWYNNIWASRTHGAIAQRLSTEWVRKRADKLDDIVALAAWEE